MNLQHASSPRTIWVDAICINQSDLVERGEQVQLMRQIYQKAATVFVFLGPSWAGLDLAVGFFEAAAAYPEFHYDPQHEPCLEVQGHNASSRELRKNLIRLLTLRWWTRLWTAQEYVLARQVKFQCGRTILDGKVAQTAYDNLRRHENTCCWDCPVVSQDDEFGIPLLHAFFQMDATESARGTSGGHQVAGELGTPASFAMTLDRDQNLKDAWASTALTSFLSVLDDFRARDCSDAKDKIYGLTGLYYSDDVAAEFSKPDYSLPVEQLYTDLVHTMIRMTGRLDVLSRARGYCEPNLDLPSFVPDWSVGFAVNIDRVARLVGYDASGGRKADWAVVDAHTVRTRAILLDELAEFGDEVGGDAAIEGTLKSWASLAGFDWEQSSFADRSGVFSKSSSFWHTLCGDILTYRVLGCLITSRIDREEPQDRAEEVVYSSYLDWYDYVTNIFMHGTRRTTNVIDFQSAFDRMTTLKRFAVTRDGRYGFFPEKARCGDVLALLPGGNEPFVLRLGLDGTYEVLGVGYIHGIMLGEAFDETRLETIHLA